MAILLVGRRKYSMSLAVTCGFVLRYGSRRHFLRPVTVLSGA